MKFVLVLTVLVTVAFAAENYKFDNIDIDGIINNDRILANYIKCAMEEGPCTKEGRELKKLLPDVLANSCIKCDQKQKNAAEKVMRHVRTKRPKDWDRLLKKYDPKGEYERRYEASRGTKA